MNILSHDPIHLTESGRESGEGTILTFPTLKGHCIPAPVLLCIVKYMTRTALSFFFY